MNIQLKSLAVAALLLSMGAPCLRADAGNQRISLDGGAAFPTGINGFDDTSRVGLLGGVQYLRDLDSHWGIGAQMDYFRFGEKDHVGQSVSGGTVNSRAKSDAVTAELIGRYTLRPDAKFVPYVQSGIGLTRYHQVSSGEPVNGSAWSDTGTAETRPLTDDSSVNFAYSAVFGVETRLTDRLILGLEGGWQIFGVSESKFGTADLNAPIAELHLGWEFGKR